MNAPDVPNAQAALPIIPGRTAELLRYPLGLGEFGLRRTQIENLIRGPQARRPKEMARPIQPTQQRSENEAVWASPI
jgi:hypothetical protein